MSIKTIQSNIERIQKKLVSLQKKISNLSKKETAKNSRILQIRKSVTRNTSQSIEQSRMREISRLEDEISAIQKKKSDLQGDIAKNTDDLYRCQQHLTKEQSKQQSNLINSIKNRDAEERAHQTNMIQEAANNPSLTADQGELFDIFISHASEDKDELVRPLVEALQRSGIKVWYDEFRLKVGDSLRRSIDKGLAGSKFGIVVLSPSFFAKSWTQYELDGLVTREIAGGKTILPLWHRVSKNDVISYSPTLADKMALNTSLFTIEELANRLVEAIT